jgi:predicted transcriptional regulator
MVTYEEWFVCEVEKGLAQIDNRETVEHSEVGLRLEAWLKATQ